MRLPEYIDFIVAPYALHKALQALTNNGVTEIAVTMEDDYLCIRYKNRKYDLHDVQDIEKKSEDCIGKIANTEPEPPKEDA